MFNSAGWLVGVHALCVCVDYNIEIESFAAVIAVADIVLPRHAKA